VRAGDAPDVEGIILATRKAEAAFRMLEAVRNATFEAYAQVRDAGR
jgi:flagellar hook-basal body complex protein FliE